MSTLVRRKTFYDFFPVPEFLLLATSGIALSDQSVKLVEFKKSSKRGELEVLHASESALPKGALEGGEIRDKEPVIAALKEFRNHLDVKYARIALPEDKAYLFTAHFDDMPARALNDAVAFIIEENVPISLADAIFDYEVVGKVAGYPGVKVAVSVLPKSVVAGYVELFESAGITPIAFDLESQAIARSVIPRMDRRATLILNLGEKKTGLYIVEDGIVQFSITPTFEGQDNAAEINPLHLRAEIQKLFVFWNTRLNKYGIPEKKLERIIVAGPGAANRAFVENVLRNADVEYSLANVWQNAFSVDSWTTDLSFEESLGYATTIGLALGTRKANNHV